MTVTGIRAQEVKELTSASRPAPSLLTAGRQRNPACLTVVAEATRERERAAVKISELGRQAVERLLRLS